MKTQRIVTGVAGASLTAVLAIATPFVADLEGRSLIAYLDSGGVPTICDGETNGVKLGQTRTNNECDKLLAGSLGKALRVVDTSVKVPFSPHQRAAWASFVYNVGEGAFKKSTALKLLNQNKVASACDQLLRWIMVKGKDCRIAKNNCRGIVRRRERERHMCLMNADMVVVDGK